MIYQGLPEVNLKHFNIEPVYGLHCLYMPIKLKSSWEFSIPASFDFLRDIIYTCMEKDTFDIFTNYIYLSYECSYVQKGIPQKRPGIHADGFLTKDINYIWYDKDPTIFYDQKFRIDKNHARSMEQFEEQASEQHEITYPVKTLLRLTEQVVHRSAIPTESGVRQFIKISISTDKYNLKGNTKNPLIDYDWIMHERSLVRNHPIYKESDTFPDEVVNA